METEKELKTSEQLSVAALMTPNNQRGKGCPEEWGNIFFNGREHAEN